MGVNICQNVLSSTLKICAFYCVELYQYKNVKKKNQSLLVTWHSRINFGLDIQVIMF